jgi:hypothetical protein
MASSRTNSINNTNDPVMSAVRATPNARVSPMISAVKSSHSPAPWATANHPSTAQDSPRSLFFVMAKQVTPSKMNARP